VEFQKKINVTVFSIFGINVAFALKKGLIWNIVAEFLTSWAVTGC
jgi:hypothetical protein